MAASLALFGLPALAYLNTTDPEERLILQALCQRAYAIHDELQQRLASRVVGELAKAVRR